MTIQNPAIDNTQDMLQISLGKLFFAIAMADNKITPEEITALKSTILHKWHIAKYPTNESNLEVQYSILSIFNKLHRTKAESDRCFLEFRLFFLEHKKIFNEELRKLIWHTAQAIASSYANKNKSELVLLAKLKLLFQS